ncbi:MAG: lysophospholipid acyltransferase family protein [Thermoguttaceae bacterium]
MKRSLLNNVWYHSLRLSLLGAAKLVYRVRFTGQENIPKRGGVLVVSNHQSHFDPPLVGVGSSRRMNYVARQTLFDFGPFGRFLKSVGAIPLDREGTGLSGIKEALRRLKRGEMVLIFPEGTRSRDGQLGVLRPGFTTLAVRSRAAILPVGVDGAFDAWPRTRKLPRLGRIRIHYGNPIPAEEIVGRDENELLAEIERRIRECLAKARQRD